MPYSWDDLIGMDEKEPLNYPFWQKLIVDKRRYSVGDSIYGYVAFSSVFYDEYGMPSRHNVAGYFRAEIGTRRD